ncbi:unnamed protein product [Ectocarpus sp. CCAP 1310/34]|nr:unnamed protein product [Ectocarpus sp. CCAP 1310/34]
MTMIRGLVGLSFICTAAGFAGPISTRLRATGSSSSSTSFKSSARQQGPQLMKGWRSSSQRTRTCMTAQQEGDASEAAPAAPAPRLKRVRRRRKDGGASVAVAGEDERKASTSVVEEQAPPPASPPVAAASQVVAPPPAVVAPPADPVAAEQLQQQQRAAAVEEEAPRSVGGTKGTKVRVVDSSDDDMSEKLAGVASAASGAAGGAASAVSGAAKSAIGAAMSMLDQGGAPAEFDIDSMPAPGKRGQAQRAGKRTTPGKTASELADLGADIERFRQAENRQPETAGESIASGAKDIISTIISIDFFVVIAFMLWFIAGVVSSYGFSNTFLLDQFNDKWTPVVQPALGVLMGGTIAGGVVSKLGGSGDDEDDNRP